jgi:hypothetical protein
VEALDLEQLKKLKEDFTALVDTYKPKLAKATA